MNTPEYENHGDNVQSRRSAPSSGRYALSQNPAYEQRHQADSSFGGYDLSQNPAYGQIHATASDQL